jgi:hypothetical protein
MISEIIGSETFDNDGFTDETDLEIIYSDISVDDSE